MKNLIFILTLLSTPVFANIVGSDFESFNPTSDGMDFVTVQSPRPMPPGYLGLGGFLDYAWNTLPPALDVNNNKFSVTDRILYSDLHASLGLLHNWDIGINASSLLTETVDDPNLKSFFARSGLTDVRANTKYRFWENGPSAWALNLTVNAPQLQNDPFYGGGSGPTYDAELIWGRRFGAWNWGLNSGYRWRYPGTQLTDSPYDRVGNFWLASSALSYRFTESKWAAIGEVYSAVPTANTEHYKASELTALEGLLGARYYGFDQFALHGGVTSAILHGTSSPDFRIYVGLTWYPMRLWGTENSPAYVAPIQKPEVVSAQNLAAFEKEPTQRVENLNVRDINFDSGSSVVPKSFRPYLEKMANYLHRGKPLKRLEIFGHTDSQGGAVYNQTLSQARAESVRDILVNAYGVDREKIEVLGMGLSHPVAPNETAVGRSINRRVEFRIEREP